MLLLGNHRISVCIAVLLGLGALYGPPAHAASVVVNTLVDENNGTTSSIANLIATPGGAGISLREAIIAANNTAGADTITFSVSGTINTSGGLGALPTLNSGNTTIDGGGVIVLNGSSQGSGQGFLLSSSSNIISGITIIRMPDQGINISNGTNNLIEDCIIGTNTAGGGGIGNGGNGISMSNTATGNTVSGCVVSGNGASGISISDRASTGNFVVGCFIGTNPAGTGALANTVNGIVMTNAGSNTSGGTLAGEGNVISGNGQHGIFLNNSNDNEIYGNIVGLAADGETALGNAQEGIMTFTGEDGNIIGAPGAGNIIAANGSNGIQLSPSTTTHLVRGNYIGTNAAGDTGLGNGGHGIDINGTQHVIGGVGAGRET